MKYRSFALKFLGTIAIALALGLSSGCNDSDGGITSSDFGDNNPDLYVAVGDSITEGYGASVDYPSILTTLIGKTVINASLGGTRTETGASAVNGILEHYKPGFLLILYGANDAIHRVDVAETSANLRYMVQAAKNNKTVPVIATLTPMSASHETFNGGVDAINVEVKRIAAEENIHIADLSSAFAGRPELMTPDGLHPNDDGQRKIAEVFANLLQ